MDIEWILTDKLCVTKLPDCYLIESVTHPTHEDMQLRFNRAGRLLFNGEDIETEDFMAYVGLLDGVNDSPNNPVIIEVGD